MIKMSPDTLSLGPDVVKLLLPHRRPLLMVDRKDGTAQTLPAKRSLPRPTLVMRGGALTPNNILSTGGAVGTAPHDAP